MLNQWLAPMVMTSALAENEYSSGGGQTAVKVGGGGGVCYLWYSIWLLGQDINWYIALSPAPVAIFIYFILLYFVFLYLTYFIFLCSYLTIIRRRRS